MPSPDTNRLEALATLVYAASVCGQAVFMWVGGWLLPNIVYTLTTVLGAWLASSGVLLAFWFHHTVPGLVLTYGLMFGAGSGIAYTPPLKCAQQWLPTNKGIANGVVVAGFGLGGFLFAKLMNLFLAPSGNPCSLGTCPEDVVDRVPWFFVMFAAIYFVIQLPSSLLLVQPPASQRQPGHGYPCSEGDEPSPIAWKDLEDKVGSTQDATPAEALRSPRFWALWVIFFCNGLAPERYWSTVAACSSVLNAVGRVGWGAAAQYFSFRNAMATLSVLFGTLVLTFSPML
eukprot:gene10255-1852_t